jgi:hypothetical protein
MTDAEKIRKLAEFIGGDDRWTYFMAGWSPLTRIQDAWMLVEKITSLPRTPEEAEKALNTRFMFWWNQANLWAYPAEKAAGLICAAILKLKGGE